METDKLSKNNNEVKNSQISENNSYNSMFI